MKRNVLLNPGPATTTQTVKEAQVVPDICPREQEFGDLMQEVAAGLTKIVADTKRYDTVLFGGSGTAAVEAVLSSVIGPQDTVFVINNGAYGSRMCQILDTYHISYVEMCSSPFEPLDIKKLETLLEKHQEHFHITHLAMIHNETTSGLLNDVETIGTIAHKYHLQMIVDAMSSYGAIPIDMEKMGITYLISSSNKNLQGMAGISFVVANRKALLDTARYPKRNYYLNLYAQYAYLKEHNQLRFTPPVQTFYALRQALRELQQETVAGRYQRYTRNWETLLDGLAELGLSTLVAREYQSHIITTIPYPDWENFDFEQMHDYLYERGFTIYPGKVSDTPTFRVANIGDLQQEDIEAFLSALEGYRNMLIRGENRND